jgi:hypothetical protein
MPSDSVREAAIRKRLEKITPGPWELEDEETTEGGHYTPPQIFSVADEDEPKIVCILAVRNGVTETNNGRFIAHAPEDVAYLLARWKDAEGLLRETQAIHAPSSCICAVCEDVRQFLEAK